MSGARHSHLARAVPVARVLPDESGGDGVERPWDGATITPTTGRAHPDRICQIADGVVDGQRQGARP